MSGVLDIQTPLREGDACFAMVSRGPHSQDVWSATVVSVKCHANHIEVNVKCTAAFPSGKPWSGIGEQPLDAFRVVPDTMDMRMLLKRMAALSEEVFKAHELRRTEAQVYLACIKAASGGSFSQAMAEDIRATLDRGIPSPAQSEPVVVKSREAMRDAMVQRRQERIRSVRDRIWKEAEAYMIEHGSTWATIQIHDREIDLKHEITIPGYVLSVQRGYWRIEFGPEPESDKEDSTKQPS